MSYLQYQQQSSSQKIQQDNNNQGIQLPSKIHYHSRQNSPTDISNLLIYNSKSDQYNNNNLYEYTESNYNPLQDSPFINFSQLEPTPSSGQKSNIKINNKMIDPVYKGQQYELKLDSDKYIPSSQQNTMKPNIFITQDQISNGNKNTQNRDVVPDMFQIQSSSISPNSVKQSTQNKQFFSTAAPIEKSNLLLPEERRILEFNDQQPSTTKKVTQIRSPVLAQKSKPHLGINLSNLKTPQTDNSEYKQNYGSSVEKNQNTNQTFEDTPEIIKMTKNVLQPQFPASYSQMSLNNPASIKIKKPSPKNSQNSQNYYTNDFQKYQSIPQQQQVQQQQKSPNQITDFGGLSPIQPNSNITNNKPSQDNRYNNNNNGYTNEKQNGSKVKTNPQQNYYQNQLDSTGKKQINSPTQDIQSLSHLNNQSLHPQQQSSQRKNTKKDNSQSENKYSSNYKAKSFGNNPIEIFDSKNLRDPNNQYFDSKNQKDPRNNYYDSRQVIPSNDRNNNSEMSDMHKLEMVKHSPYKPLVNSHQLNQQGIQKLIEFPQKKRELLEQQRQLLQQEREILEREKELIDQEEEIFYETSQGHLNSMSPSRSSHNPLNMNTTPKEQRQQNYYQNNSQQNENPYPQIVVNQFQYPNNEQSVKHSNQPLQQSIDARAQPQQNFDNSYDKKIRESQQIDSEYKLKFMQNPQNEVQITEQKENSNIKKSLQNDSKKQNPFYYTLNSLHGSKNSQSLSAPFQNNDQVKDANEQNFQRQKGDLEQSFHANLNGEEENKVKDILKYFKQEQDSSSKYLSPNQPQRPQQENSNFKNKIIQLPLSMKKELSQKNRQPQITNQSPEKSEDTIVLELTTPQKNHDQKQLNSFLPSQSPSLLHNDGSSINNPNFYLIKKPKIFSPKNSNNRSFTPQTSYLSRNNKPQKISTNHQEFGVQVDDNSFHEQRQSQNNKGSPNSENNTKKTLNNSELRSVGYQQGDYRVSSKQGFSNASSPVVKAAYPQNDVSTNDYVESHLPNNMSSQFISNKQSLLKPEQLLQDKNRSVSNPHLINPHKQSIEYVYQNKPNQNKKRDSGLCFGCGDTQMSTENNLILDSQQNEYKYNQQRDYMTQQQPQAQQPIQIQTFQTQPQEFFYPQNKLQTQPHETYNQFTQNNEQYNPSQNIQSNPINQNTLEDQKPLPRLQTQHTFNQDSIRSPYFREEKDDQVKRSKISPQKIFNTRPTTTTKSGLQFSVEKISYDPTDYKNRTPQNIEGIHTPLSTSFYPNEVQQKNTIGSTTPIGNKAPIKQSFKINNNNNNNNNNTSFNNPGGSQNNSFINQKPNNEQLDFSYLNTSSNISGVFHLNSQEIFCDKCLEFINASRYDTHHSICSEMNQFQYLDRKKQMELINQKILKIAYLVKRKNTSTSPIRGQQGNGRQLANPRTQQNEQSDQVKLTNYCNYLNECLSELSHKTISYQDFLQGKEDLKLIIQRIKSVKEHFNMSYYGERALDILEIKQNILTQNPI